MNPVEIDIFTLYPLAKADKEGQEALDLGDCYFHGRGVSRDLRQAVHYYKVAHSKEIPEALTRLGNCYAKGLGVEKDYDRAFVYYDQSDAPDDHYKVAQYHHFKSDFKRAHERYMYAAHRGHKEAMRVLVHNFTNGIGCEINLLSAQYWHNQSIKPD